LSLELGGFGPLFLGAPKGAGHALARVREQVAIAGVNNLTELNGGRLDAQTLGSRAVNRGG